MTNEDVVTSIDAAYDAWKEADAVSRAVLHEVSQAWYRHDWGFGNPPSSDLLDKAAGLQHEANERLGRAIQILHDTGRIQPAPRQRSRRRLAGGLQLM